MSTKHFISLAAILLATLLQAQNPQTLRVDLMEHTDTEFAGGYAMIRSAQPVFSWAYPQTDRPVVQKAYRVLVATSPELLKPGKADMWDSGKRKSSESDVNYQGRPLLPSKTYCWTVRTWTDTEGRGDFAEPRAFTTADILGEQFSFYPLHKTHETASGNGSFYDFGKAAFAQLSFRVKNSGAPDSLTVLLGEACRGEAVDITPQGSIRFAQYTIPVRPGTHDYQLSFRPDKRNSEQNPANNESGVLPILMPESIGEVFPFRYVQVKGRPEVLEVSRQTVHVPFDDDASQFESSDSVLNEVWELCKYSIKATSFAGIYVDGDRERIPYEADALVNQLSHYAVDSEYTMARRTTAHLIDNPTWPTEWILLTPTLAWLDYMHTGDIRLLERYYEALQPKALLSLREANGLISTRTGKVSAEVLSSISFNGKGIRDIVDWPQSGAAGIEKEASGEADGYVMSTFSTVVNAYHYEALRTLSLIAGALGLQEDEAFYRQQAERVRDAVNHLLFDKERGVYVDGIGTGHASLHANMFPLAFGMVPEKYRSGVTDFVKSRRMACSVYGAQFLLDALYNEGEDEYALSLMNSTGLRSWYNMIRMGSTISTEAWDNVYKPNLDWNHAWGAVPANIIVRRLMGIEPLEPGFGKLRIAPQPGGLQSASLKYPTVRGTVYVAFEKQEDGSYSLDVRLPANVEAEIIKPE